MGVPLAGVVREGTPGGLDDQPTPAQPVRGTVLSGRQPVSLIGVQAEMHEALSAVMAEEAIGVLIQDTETAVAVLVADPHARMVSVSGLGV